MKKYLKELVLWVFMAIPFIYLAYIWNSLPERVPTHFGEGGNADDWSSKTSLLLIPGAIGIGNYLLMLLIPLLTQKAHWIYYRVRFVVTLFLSLLITYCYYLSSAGTMRTPYILLAIFVIFFVLLFSMVILPVLRFYTGFKKEKNKLEQ